MNEVLKKLHDEAVIYTVSLCGQEHALGPRPFQEVLDDKFAELLVNECINVVIDQKKCVEDQEVFNPRDELWNRARIQQSQSIIDKIDQHFGIKR